MKKISRKAVLLVMSIVLILSISVGAALAYFSDYTANKGEVQLALKGGTETEEKIVDNKKVVTIHNTGETIVVVRVGIFGPEGMEVKKEDGWTELNGFYYYDKAILPGGQTTSITASAETVGTEIGDDMEIIVVHESEPAQYKDGKLVPMSEWFK